jgi:hypothetical protein
MLSTGGGVSRGVTAKACLFLLCLAGLSQPHNPHGFDVHDPDSLATLIGAAHGFMKDGFLILKDILPEMRDAGVDAGIRSALAASRMDYLR